MLGTPRAGWSDLKVNGRYIGTASYLDWLPGLVLGECMKYMQGQNSFDICFDAEGYHFGIVSIANSFYAYIYNDGIKISDEIGYGKKFVRELMAEVISDLERDFENWVRWDSFTKEDERRNREELRFLIASAKDILKKGDIL